jgi:CDP-glucose 4,6-dehydratase
MPMDPDFWRGKRVLLTGHTGFKGSWASLWLQSLGADLHGLALAPSTEPNLFTAARVAQGMQSTEADIREYEPVLAAMARCSPEVVIHMAAQALVRESYEAPVATYATNVMGTVHVLEAARQVGGVKAVVVVTTDKCYENREWPWGYRENEAMGGHDPYSSSKGCAELVTSAYRRSFFSRNGPAVATGRAGNVIGGGDWAADRLVPDVLRAFERREPVAIRNPLATRPWQHVLEPLSGYMLLARQLHSEGERWAQAWNFGPSDEDVRPVRWVVEHLAASWGSDAQWQQDERSHPHEAHDLKLDISKARTRLGWHPRWNLQEALDRVTGWHRAWLDGQDARELCLQQIRQYTNSMRLESA